MRPPHLASSEDVILRVRGQRVILSPELARIYGVEPRVLNQAVKRNRERFPFDFAFQLTKRETEQVRRSRSHSVILKRGANTKYFPLAFTEHGAIMAANVLSAPTAVQMSIFVVRAFLRLRQWVADQAELVARLADLEHRVGRHDRDVAQIIKAIRRLFQPVGNPGVRRIGFGAGCGPTSRAPGSTDTEGSTRTPHPARSSSRGTARARALSGWTRATRSTTGGRR